MGREPRPAVRFLENAGVFSKKRRVFVMRLDLNARGSPTPFLASLDS